MRVQSRLPTGVSGDGEVHVRMASREAPAGPNEQQSTKSGYTNEPLLAAAAAAAAAAGAEHGAAAPVGQLAASQQLPPGPGSSVTGGSDEVTSGASIMQALSFINANKLAAVSRPVPAAAAAARPGSASARSSDGSSSSGVKWVQPSGPRRPGEGVENEEQGIIAADQTASGSVMLRITLLAAGFIIGPAGSSVRDIMRISGCDIKSWTEQPGSRARRPCRVFLLEGEEADIVSAMTIITAAVDRYKELCEGGCSGQAVGRLQRVMGVEFSYQPPPKSIVPFAAALKGHVQRPARVGLGTAFDTLLQPQPAAAMAAVTGTALPQAGSAAPFFPPYPNFLIPPGSPTGMAPYPAGMYGLAAMAGPPGSPGADGGFGAMGGPPGGMLSGYDYSYRSEGGGGASGGGGSMYSHPGSGTMGSGGGAGLCNSPSSPTGGSWVMGSAPGGMMMLPPSPVRYGMPSPGGPAVMGLPPMGLPAMGMEMGGMGMPGPFMGGMPTGLVPEMSWQMGPFQTGTGAGNVGMESGMAGGGMYPLSRQGSGGLMYSQPMMTWFGGPGSAMGMYYPSPGAGPQTPAYQYAGGGAQGQEQLAPGPGGPRSPTRTFHPGARPPASPPGSRLNPRAAPWSTHAAESQERQPQREHTSRQQQLQQHPAGEQQQGAKGAVAAALYRADQAPKPQAPLTPQSSGTHHDPRAMAACNGSSSPKPALVPAAAAAADATSASPAAPALPAAAASATMPAAAAGSAAAAAPAGPDEATEKLPAGVPLSPNGPLLPAACATCPDAPRKEQHSGIMSGSSGFRSEDD